MFETVSAQSWLESQYVLSSSIPSFSEEIYQWERLSSDANFIDYPSFIECYGSHERQQVEIFKAKNKKKGKVLLYLFMVVFGAPLIVLNLGLWQFLFCVEIWIVS